MKLSNTIICVSVFAAMAAALADEPLATANSAALDAAKEYRALLDQMIITAIASGPGAIQANDVAMGRALEYELLADNRLHVIRRSDLPAMVFAEGPPPELRQLPGRALELRLLKVGVNPFQDGMATKSFDCRSEKDAEGGTIAFLVPTATNTYPKSGDFVGEYAYATSLINRREWADAARHLAAAAAVQGGTTTGEWEFQILITEAWAQVMNGDFPAAKTTLQTAFARPHECEVPPRCRFLERLFGGEGLYLAPEIQAALPDRK
jgi:hypothetical protein